MVSRPGADANMYLFDSRVDVLVDVQHTGSGCNSACKNKALAIFYQGEPDNCWHPLCEKHGGGKCYRWKQCGLLKQPTPSMLKGWDFDLGTKDFLPHFLDSLMKLPNAPVVSWQKMVANIDGGHPVEVEGEYRSSERPNFR